MTIKTADCSQQISPTSQLVFGFIFVNLIYITTKAQLWVVEKILSE